LAKKAFEVIVAFVTTYWCEQSFSVMIVVKNKQCNRLEAMFAPDPLKDRASSLGICGE